VDVRIGLAGVRCRLTGEGYDALNEGRVSVECEENCSKPPSALPHQLDLRYMR